MKTRSTQQFAAVLTTIISLLSLTGCVSDADTAPFKVEYKGALKNIMRKGDLSAKAALSAFENSEHLYGLGALENLKGEIQIFDGIPYNTFVEDGMLAFDKTFSKNATLLVYAVVNSWSTFEIPAHVKSKNDLEKFIVQTAKDAQVDVDKPFPFLIEGRPRSLDWHVINWNDGDTEHSHEKHISSGLHGTLRHQDVEMLGFYSDSHHAVFTHHTTNMHIHVKTKDGALAGHVDDVTMDKGMSLKLPVIEPALN